jgi:AraC family transcriptional regulator
MDRINVRSKGQLDPKALEQHVELEFRGFERPPHGQRRITWRGLSAETVTMHGAREFDYKWSGSTHYLAVHDISLEAGETLVDDLPPARQLDMRDLLTFIPEGCSVTGWSKLRSRTNTFTAVYYDPAILPEEMDARLAGIERPKLYFDHPWLRMTLVKIQALLVDPDPIDAIYGETLGLAAAVELARLQFGGPRVFVPDSGRLSVEQEKRVRDYIATNLHRNVSLSDLASLVGLSRFHFSRSFRRTTGLAPYQFILSSRVERAKTTLAETETSMLEISASLGFGTQAQFSAAFRKLTGLTPSQFRRSRR